MKPKLVLTVASVLYLVLGLYGFFAVAAGEFNFQAYLSVVFTFCLSFLFWRSRNAPVSKSLDAVLFTGLLAFFAGGILALYAQWSGNYLDTAYGYFESLFWLAMAVWFFLVGRVNMSTGA